MQKRSRELKGVLSTQGISYQRSRDSGCRFNDCSNRKRLCKDDEDDPCNLTDLMRGDKQVTQCKCRSSGVGTALLGAGVFWIDPGTTGDLA